MNPTSHVLLILFPLLLSYTTSSIPNPLSFHISSTNSRSSSTLSSPSPPLILDPKQFTALQSLNISISKNPCSQPSLHNATLCNNAKPFRDLISLHLINCSNNVEISRTAIESLITLQELEFLNCPISPVKFPSELIANLHSFTCINSLHKLTGFWLSHLQNLTDLTVSKVTINASKPSIILCNMKKLRSVTISHTNLTGFLPKQWNPNITHIDLSGNQLTGKVPRSLTRLMDLEFLNLSSNALSGELPSLMGNLFSLRNVSFACNSLSGQVPDSISEIPGLVHLDLSSNQFNGTIPKFLSQMKNLVYLNLENNNFNGVLPFNESVIKRFVVFKVDGNSNLCYNHSMVSSRLKLGIAPCDKNGVPISTSPEFSSDSAKLDDCSSGENNDTNSDDENIKKNKHLPVPSKIVLGVAIGLSSIVFLIVFLVLLSKWCK